MQHVVDCPERGHDEKAAEPGGPAGDELLHESVYHVSLQLDAEVVHQAEEADYLRQANEHIIASVAMLHLEDYNVGEKYAVHVDVMAAGPESKRFSILQGRVLAGPEADEEDHEGLGARVEYPHPELCHIEDHILHADAIVERSAQQDALFELKVHQSVPDIVQARERHIVNLVDPLFVHGLAAEDGVIPKHELHHDVEHVLIEHE